jgi:4-hydroxy-tetrahydrodipicolinate reductase
VTALRVGVFGAGRLGGAIAAEAQAQGALAWNVTRQAPPDGPLDAAIEATVAAAVEARLTWALGRGVPLIIGTTGWSIPDLRERVGDRIGVVLAPNFSLGVALVARLTRVLAGFAALDPTRDPYVLEHHHARKHDAPSGTAKMLARAVLEGCPRKTEWTLGGPVAPHQLSVGVLRAGATYSSHTVGVDSPGEVVEVHHAARSAAVFAQGALAAARWVQGRRGVFSMDDVSHDLLEPLFKVSVAAPSRQEGAAGCAATPGAKT